MSTHILARRAGAAAPAAESASYTRVAGSCAMLAGATGFLYALAFIVLRSDLWSALFLLLGGLLSAVALVAVYARLRETDASFALLAAILSLAGALGATIHGGYDLANAIHPPASASTLPDPIDPRGLLTFGGAGLGLALIAWLMSRDARFPLGLSYLGYALAGLLVALYLSRLIILDAKNPLVVVLALLSGFLANPAWYIWLGLTLRRQPQQADT